MEKNLLLCIQGESGTGKTTLINEVVKTLKKKYCLEDETTSMVKELGLEENMPKDPQDCWLVLKKDEKVIIVQSEGDYVYSYKNTETYLEKAEVGSILVLCALRTGDKQTQLMEELKKIQELCPGKHESMELKGPFEVEKLVPKQEQVLRHIYDWMEV